MINLKCLLFGHKPLKLSVFKEGIFIKVKDPLGNKLLNINICKRCSTVYASQFQKIK